MKKILKVILSGCLFFSTCIGFFGCNKTSIKLEIATTMGDLKGYEGFETDENVLRGLYEAGFRNIDFSMGSFDYMQEDWREEVDLLKGLADELGMKFVQSHAASGNPLVANEQEMEDMVNSICRQIEVCEAFGIENMVVHSGYKEGLTKEDWFIQNKAFYERVLPTAEECGVNILCENSTQLNTSGNYFINSGKEMREFIKYVNHPNFHGCWDTGHGNC